ncbi:hypothetical protein [Bradyrhizobium sp. Arg816]|uniref:hypothetical protein n=1 Tax=Bradyrhizobium sp. Arg816 TaxID=2998491 RepID=UPI00249F217E|nr:hypothetical protein [Bradyrhizobium sp. Arg816]MDI3567594.1 hypothetical protein [Bradyrhizobium sp. Arg816]
MTSQSPALTIVLNHPAAETYARLIRERFPQVRAIVAPDRGQLEQHIGEADALLAFHFPVEFFEQAKKLPPPVLRGLGLTAIRTRSAKVWDDLRAIRLQSLQFTLDQRGKVPCH